MFTVFLREMDISAISSSSFRSEYFYFRMEKKFIFANGPYFVTHCVWHEITENTHNRYVCQNHRLQWRQPAKHIFLRFIHCQFSVAEKWWRIPYFSVGVFIDWKIDFYLPHIEMLSQRMSSIIQNGAEWHCLCAMWWMKW